MKYRNPIITGFFPDPSIVRVGEDYYMVHSSFEYLPAIPISHSKDLIHWEIISYCITSPEQMTFEGVPASEGLYAPTLRYHDGTFYVVCTNVSMGGNFYMTATDPMGPWSEPIFVKQGGIDPSLFFDDDGTAYFTSNGWKNVANIDRSYIQQSVIDIKTGELLTEPRLISYGYGGRCVEAPHIYHIGKWYYLFTAEGGTDVRHMAAVLRSDNPWGPYESHPDNPILTARDINHPFITATGHVDLIEDTYGQLWLVFLCYRMPTAKYHHQGRETSMVPLAIDENGWPYVVTGKGTPEIVDLPDRKGPEDIAEGWRTDYDDFAKCDKLDLRWNFMREFLTDYSLTENPGYLTLTGNAHTLNDRACPAWIGRRHVNFNMESKTALTFSPNAENEEAGLSAVCSNLAWYALTVSVRDGRKVLLYKRRVEDMFTETVTALPDELALTDAPIELYVSADREYYYFGYYYNGEKIQVGSGLTKLLSTEVNWGFTGAMLAMYATGGGVASTAPAKYAYFSYTGDLAD